jgi:hypothetical protein
MMSFQECSSHKIAARPERRRQFENDLRSSAEVALSLLTACLGIDQLKEQVNFLLFKIVFHWHLRSLSGKENILSLHVRINILSLHVRISSEITGSLFTAKLFITHLL